MSTFLFIFSIYFFIKLKKMKNHVHVHSSVAITMALHIVSRNSANWDLLLNSFGSHWAMSSPPGGYDDSIITSAVKFSKWTFEADLETKLPTRFEAIGTINPFLKKKSQDEELPSSPPKNAKLWASFLLQEGWFKLSKQAKQPLKRKKLLLGTCIRTRSHH